MEVSKDYVSSKAPKNNLNHKIVDEAIVVLKSLGYTQEEYSKALDLALTKLEKEDSQELIKEALKILSVF